MRSAMSQLQMSARGFHRVLKLARTIADLADSESIHPAHPAEAQRPTRKAAGRIFLEMRPAAGDC